ncbi:hypothetical protein F7018_08575 [Tenacibaculum aiptasiae]|uniref:Uncharacterized protein n=1 Tax=Tenacibaculum aiptasiae TaxID=426481 RepID=A0A7J5AM44_9FLAO|nr:hypothetical protein [Tenacibaculum aiptasiae]KAB1158662.1 hypothetical protein F7018_08575 [Tenacibaculum aiptasiae]
MENDIKTIPEEVNFIFCVKHFSKCFSSRKNKKNPLKELFSELLGQLMKDELIKNKTINGCFTYFVNTYLGNDEGKPKYAINKKTLISYHNKYANNILNKSGEPANELKDLMSQYIGYKNYEDFLNKNRNKKICILCITKYKKTFLLGFFSILPFFIYFSLNKSNESCIVWKGDHYEKSSCFNIKAINNNKYNINITLFKKIYATDTTTFFINGDPIVWYGKNKKREFEFFNHRGIHPETHKELKPITPTIIKQAKLYRP